MVWNLYYWPLSVLYQELSGRLSDWAAVSFLVPATLFIGINLGMIDGITPQSVVGLSVIMMIFTGLSSTLILYENENN